MASIQSYVGMVAKILSLLLYSECFQKRRARKRNDPLEDIPVVILREIRAELDAKRLPNWWYATFPFKELDETLGRVKAEG